ncbi:hypothetical protein BKA62DRAFT_723706 [Auriculariales sp. MPI-PUGE-AT-0066]|nr:hypothetical protein BKA62DRAFT_723706 [Auriculariales sp. MPI-PUGE-AT-0066]
MGVDQLTPDVLGDIFLELQPSSISQKIALSRVSQVWRAVALGLPQLWATFVAEKREDYEHLALTLHRAGDALPIRAELKQFGTGWGVAGTMKVALLAMVPFVPRLARFHVRTDLSITPLLNSHLEFPLSLKAPRLEKLVLRNAEPDGLRDILAPSLKSIEIFMCNVTSGLTLADIFPRCRHLEQLQLHTHPFGDGWDEQGGEDYDLSFLDARPLAPALNYLDVRLPIPVLNDLVSRGFSDVVLQSLSGSIYNGHYIDYVEALATPLLKGCKRITSFEFVSADDIVVRDDAGRVRRFQTFNEDSSWEISEFWQYLVEKHDAHKTVRHWQIRVAYWDNLVEAFESFPPDPEGNEGTSLAIQAGYDEVGMVSAGSKFDLSTLNIPRLAKVSFVMNDSSRLNPEVIVECLRYIEVPDGRTIEVCIGGIPLKGDAPPWEKRAVVGDALNQIEGSKWRLCSHCTPNV